MRYNRDIPNLTKYCFLSVLSDGANTKMGSIFTPYEYYYSWNKANEDEKVSNGISALLTMIKGAFSKGSLISILRDFIYYPDDESKELAIVTRYPQYFAANKMLENIKAHLKPKFKTLPAGRTASHAQVRRRELFYFNRSGCKRGVVTIFPNTPSYRPIFAAFPCNRGCRVPSASRYCPRSGRCLPAHRGG